MFVFRGRRLFLISDWRFVIFFGVLICDLVDFFFRFFLLLFSFLIFLIRILLFSFFSFLISISLSLFKRRRFVFLWRLRSERRRVIRLLLLILRSLFLLSMVLIMLLFLLRLRRFSLLLLLMMLILLSLLFFFLFFVGRWVFFMLLLRVRLGLVWWLVRRLLLLLLLLKLGLRISRFLLFLFLLLRLIFLRSMRIIGDIGVVVFEVISLLISLRRGLRFLVRMLRRLIFFFKRRWGLGVWVVLFRYCMYDSGYFGLFVVFMLLFL